MSWNSGSLQPSSIASIAAGSVTSQWEKMLQGRSVTKLMNFRRKSIQISRTQAHILWCWVPPKKKSAEILGKTIESAEVHYTFCDVEFRRTIGLNTKFRWKKKSADVRCIICVVEFRRKTKKNIVRKKNCQRSRGTGPQKFRRIFFFCRSQDVSCPIIVRNGKKVHKVCKISCWKN